MGVGCTVPSEWASLPVTRVKRRTVSRTSNERTGVGRVSSTSDAGGPRVSTGAPAGPVLGGGVSDPRVSSGRRGRSTGPLAAVVPTFSRGAAGPAETSITTRRVSVIPTRRTPRTERRRRVVTVTATATDATAPGSPVATGGLDGRGGGPAGRRGVSVRRAHPPAELPEPGPKGGRWRVTPCATRPRLSPGSASPGGPDVGSYAYYHLHPVADPAQDVRSGRRAPARTGDVSTSVAT